MHEEIKSIATAIVEEVKSKEIDRLWERIETVQPAKRPCPEGAIQTKESNGKFDMLLQFLFLFFFSFFLFIFIKEYPETRVTKINNV